MRTSEPPAEGARRRAWLWGGVLYAATATSVSAALFVRSATEAGARLSLGEALVWQGAAYFSWAAAVPLVLAVGRRARLGEGAWWAALPAYGALGVVVVAGHAALVAALDRAFGAGGTFGAVFVGRLPIDLLVYCAVVGVAYAAAYHARYAERRTAAADLERQLAEAQLHALKAQLQPHFLFNALQALTVLIKKDPDAAVRMTVRLGDLLRATLQRARAQEVPLRDELALLGNYLAVEEVRFGDRLAVTFDVEPDTLDLLVPDLLLQPLAENALKHGLGPKRGPGRLMVRARLNGDRLLLAVEDDGVGLPDDYDPADVGIGLAATRERLQALYGADHVFALEAAAGGGARACIELPAHTDGAAVTGELAHPVDAWTR